MPPGRALQLDGAEVDPLRPPCGRATCEAWRGEPRDLRLPRFTHFCTRSRRWGSFVIGRKTIKKCVRAKLKAIKVELCKSMHNPIEDRSLGEADAARASELLRRLGQRQEPVVVLQRGEVARSGSNRSSGAARTRGSPGRSSPGSSPASFRQYRYYIRRPVTASTPTPEGHNRTLEDGPKGHLCPICHQHRRGKYDSIT